MNKRIIQITGALLLLFITMGLLLYFTDNRYTLSVKSYNALNNATSMDLSFESRIGIGENNIGIIGDTQLTVNPNASYTEVRLDLATLGNPKIVDIYTSNEQVFHKYNLFFLPWQQGMPIIQEDAFNPAMFGQFQMDLKLLDLLKFVSILEEERNEELLEYYTTDYLTVEEFKMMLVNILKLDEGEVLNWNIKSYEIRFSFHKEKKELERIAIEFDHDVSDMDLNNQFILTIHELNNVIEITAPVGLPLN